MVKILKILVFFLFPFLPSAIVAVSPSVIINEIAWMGTENSYNDEWIELYNNSSFNLDLEGWKLTAEDGSPAINLTGKVLAKSFFLLERTDDETLPGIKADLIYKGSLNNEGEHLKLVTKDGEMIDETNCSSEWFAGDNKTKATMERKDPLVSGNSFQNWQTSWNSSGTPKTKNSQGEKEPEAKGAKPELIETTSYPSNIFINEVLPSPEGPDAEEEWIEIFNQNNFEVNLSGWEITDSIGKTKSYTFPEGTTIKGQGFLILNRVLTKITLNNDGDILILLQPNEKTIDRVEYEKAPRGKSFNRINSNWLWSMTLTPGVLNVISSLPPEQNQEEIKSSPQQTVTFSDIKKESELAAISKQIPEHANSLPILPIALTVAFLSGAIVLFLKKSTFLLPNSPEEDEQAD